MHALLDMPVSPSLVQIMRLHGHDATHASHIGLDRSADNELVRLARDNGWIVITADLDFPHLLALSKADGPGIVLFRGGNYSDVEMQELLTRVLNTVPADVIQSSICVVDRSRVRITRLPLG